MKGLILVNMLFWYTAGIHVFEQRAYAIIYYWIKSQGKDTNKRFKTHNTLSQIILTWNSNMNNTNRYMDNNEPLFTFKHTSQIEDGRSST
jgi:hypothetical protein